MGYLFIWTLKWIVVMRSNTTHQCKTMMLKCAHFIKLMKFIALDQNISWSMRTKAKNLTFKPLQLNYYLWYSCMSKNIF